MGAQLKVHKTQSALTLNMQNIVNISIKVTKLVKEIPLRLENRLFPNSKQQKTFLKSKTKIVPSGKVSLRRKTQEEIKQIAFSKTRVF